MAEKETLALLFCADRLDHFQRELKAPLAAGKTVVCDRYSLSTYAYQMTAENVEWIEGINSRARRPDITLFLDVSVEASLKRLASRSNRELFDDPEELAEIRAAYLKAIDLLREAGERVEILDGEAPEAEVTAALLKEVMPLYQLA